MVGSPANFEGVGRAWYLVPEIRERILDLKGCILLPELGSPAPSKTQGCDTLNKDFLIPLIRAMRVSKSLYVPSLDQIFAQLEQLWQTHHAHQKKKKSPKGAGRYPKMGPDFQLPASTVAHCWSDAKGIKGLLCYLRKQFLSDRVSKEPQLMYVAVRTLEYVACGSSH